MAVFRTGILNRMLEWKKGNEAELADFTLYGNEGEGRTAGRPASPALHKHKPKKANPRSSGVGVRAEYDFDCSRRSPVSRPSQPLPADDGVCKLERSIHPFIEKGARASVVRDWVGSRLLSHIHCSPFNIHALYACTLLSCNLQL
jgi:hypothetical protein